MSATSQDTHPENAGEALCVDTSALPHAPPGAIDVSDPTEDLANDVTSELTPIQLRTRAQMQPDVDCGSVLRDRYVLEQQLAGGGTAMIFRANDLRRDIAAADGPRVAIKLLRAALRGSPQHIARLQREFRQTQALSHPNIVRFHDLDCDRGTWFIAMELLEGETLGTRLRRAAPQPLPMDEAIRIAAATAEALAFAHERGVTHGDVKPDNIFVTAWGPVRLLDFGVAPESPPRAEEYSSPDPAVAAATRAYASPQVLEGDRPESRDDVFSLACVIYEMLAGRHPYGRRGADFAQSSQVTLEAPASLTAAQWAVLARGLAWSREPRPDVRGLMRGLREEPPARPLPQVPVAAPAPVAPVKRSGQPAGSWRLVAATGLAFILGIAISRFNGESPGAVDVDAGTMASPEEAGALPDREGAAMSPMEPASSAELTASAAAAPLTESPPATPPPPLGLVAFDKSSMVVSSRAVVAAIPVRHLTRARRDVEVGWRAIDGSALSGRDYGGPQSGVETFAEGHTFRIIYVPLMAAARATGERAFTVELTDTSPGASLGMTRRIVVTILDDA